ncbi:MAG: cardiolipin synthase B [Betaproteobacteria bacterium RIFCSPLOWO2_02_FULL_67_26]|nr:MAG: cardiolipin synthase B [Betaproteobacteria bacterium RIFCSPLOWO2_02_FULL_67_26]
MTEFVNGNRITLLRAGADYFPALEAAIHAARREIHLETYIFEGDATGRAIGAALMAAARRGVAVHVLVDGFGSQELDRALVHEMRAAGVRLLVYRPNISPWTLRRARLRRMHRKIAVADARVAFVGGINVVDDTEDPGAIPPRFDYAVRIEGPLLAKIHPVVTRLWNLVCATQFLGRLPEAARFAPSTEFCGAQRAAFVVRDNIRHRRDIEQAYLTAIGQARSEIVIANAYFFPGRTFRRALLEAAARGVRVVLLLQGRVEYVLQHYASRALYGAFLDAGIEIHEYHKSYLHAKVAVVDRHWATVGSSNIDPFSLLLARESNVVIEDDGFAGELRTSLLAAMTEGAVQVRRERWKNQPWTTRVMTWTSYGLARFLTGVFAYGRAEEFQ